MLIKTITAAALGAMLLTAATGAQAQQDAAASCKTEHATVIHPKEFEMVTHTKGAGVIAPAGDATYDVILCNLNTGGGSGFYTTDKGQFPLASQRCLPLYKVLHVRAEMDSCAFVRAYRPQPK